jgi:hypothetical protein
MHALLPVHASRCRRIFVPCRTHTPEPRTHAHTHTSLNTVHTHLHPTHAHTTRGVVTFQPFIVGALVPYAELRIASLRALPTCAFRSYAFVHLFPLELQPGVGVWAALWSGTGWRLDNRLNGEFTRWLLDTLLCKGAYTALYSVVLAYGSIHALSALFRAHEEHQRRSALAAALHSLRIREGVRVLSRAARLWLTVRLPSGHIELTACCADGPVGWFGCSWCLSA